MKFYVTEDVFAKLPDAEFGLVSVSGMDNHGSPEAIRALLDEGIAQCEEKFKDKKVKEEPMLQPYREAFRAIGINPNRYMCAAEALMTRIAKGQGMPVISPAVDLGNALSLLYELPIGAHDLDTMIDDAFGVRAAVSGDSFLPFGAEEREPVPEGEIVYATGSHVRTRRWTWRQGDEGMITPETSTLLYIIDGFADRHEDILTVRAKLAELAAEHLHAEVKEGLIDAKEQEFLC